MKAKRKPLLVIGGPTASGKTALSIALALRHQGEIVSADSMQMYRRMNIATAKPTREEMQGIPHHLLDILDPGQSFSVADYVALARPLLAEIHERGHLPILVGGTGLYLSAMVDNLQFSPAPSDPDLRRELHALAQREGNEALYGMLQEEDPQAAACVHPNNIGRVVRALEIRRLTGMTREELVAYSHSVPSPYQSCVLALDFVDRQKLYDRIDRRVDQMLAQGLVDEARGLWEESLSPTATQAIGYKELQPYLAGEESLQAAADRIKLETRHYAKRQLTWFRRMAGIQWLYVDQIGSQEELVRQAERLAGENGVFAG